MAGEQDPLSPDGTKSVIIQPSEEAALKNSEANTSHMVRTESFTSEIGELLQKNKMAGEQDPLIPDDTNSVEIIQPSEEAALNNSEANTSHMVRTESFTSEIGVLLQKIKENMDTNSCSTQEIKIQKVPEIMLRNKSFDEYFKPRELSIGPIHGADPKLFKLELKLKLAGHFAKRRKRTAEYLFNVIYEQICKIKTHFDQNVIEDYTEKELSWLLFLDGSAMLEFIHNFMNESLNVFNISNGQAALIKQDFFLLENQMPLLVLALLTEDNTIYNWPQAYELENDFLRFIFTSTSSFPRDWNDFKGPFPITERKPVHVLDLLRYVCIINDMSPPRLRSLFFCDCFCRGCSLSAHSTVPKDWSKKHSFRNVQELKTAGIKFKTTVSLKEVSFHSGFFAGQLNLPTFIVDNSTPYILFNLVAYEMCLPNNQSDKNDARNAINNYWVTSYISLLDLLIDSDQDVKDLRSADIIRKHLSSDTFAANMINTLGSYCIAPPKDTYAHVKNGIEKHYRRSCAKWMTQVCGAHCSSPLTIFALLVATTYFALTIVQTHYAIHPKQ